MTIEEIIRHHILENKLHPENEGCTKLWEIDLENIARAICEEIEKMGTIGPRDEFDPWDHLIIDMDDWQKFKKENGVKDAKS